METVRYASKKILYIPINHIAPNPHQPRQVFAPEELRVEKRLERQHAVVLTHVAEKDFTFSDTLTLSPGREGAAEILTSRAAGTASKSSPSREKRARFST